MKKELPSGAPANLTKDESSHDRGQIDPQKAERHRTKRENNQYLLTVQTTYFRTPFFKPVRNNDRTLTAVAEREETD